MMKQLIFCSSTSSSISFSSSSPSSSSSKFPSSVSKPILCSEESSEDDDIISCSNNIINGDDHDYDSIRRKEMNQHQIPPHIYNSLRTNNWNVMRMRGMISLFLMCGLLMSFTTTCGAAATATTAAPISPDDMQTATSTTSQISGNCSQVKCPPVESCPEDSYRLPSLVEPKKQGIQSKNGGACCPATSSQRKCQCIPGLLCASQDCPSGWVAHILKNATGKPGECCPKYECLPADAASGVSIKSTGEIKSNHHQQSHQHALNYHNPPEKLHGAHPYHPSTSDINFDSSDFSLDDFRGGSSSSQDESDEEDDDSDIDEDSAENLLEASDKNSKKIIPLLTDHDKSSSVADVENDDDGHCFHNDKIYKSGGTWTVESECSQCFCERGLVSCKPIACDVPAECRLARAQPLSCCPVCDGCVSASGKAYNMSEAWQEDPCTNCSCVGGRIQCHVSMCKRQHSCATPKHYPGECCPRCENEPPDTGYPHPISASSLSSTSSQSHLDRDSCPFRECHRDISCPNGFRLDKSGCPTCECQKCQSLLGCKLSCGRGFQIDSFGCTLCACLGEKANNVLFPSSSSQSRNGNNEANQQEEISSLPSSGSSLDQSSHSSPSVKLDQRNLLGNPGSSSNKDLIGRDGQQFQYHDENRYNNRRRYHHDGNDALDQDYHDLYGYGYGSNEAKSSSSISGSSSFPSFCAVDTDGLRRMEGEEWSDHCRRCVCRNGKEMCSLITCQAPKCEHPIFYPGDCCPRCPVEETSVSFSHVNVSVCLDGTDFRVEGEIWTLSSCLTCVCRRGQVYCTGPDCPPTPCNSPKLVDCCLQCPEEEGNRIDQDGNKDGQHSATNLHRNCLSDDSIKTYMNGETWRVGACQSCACKDGNIQCFSAGKCPQLECSRPVLAKNQCCPICLGKMEHTSRHHSIEGFELHHIHGSNNLGHQHGNSVLTSSTTTTTTRGPGGAGIEPHCAVLIASLLVLLIACLFYIVRQVCFHRRVSRRLIKKVPVGFHSSSSSHSPSVTPDCCYKCDYSKYCDTGGCVIGESVGGVGGSSSGGVSRTSSTGHLSEQKQLLKSNEQSNERAMQQQQLLKESDKV